MQVETNNYYGLMNMDQSYESALMGSSSERNYGRHRHPPVAGRTITMESLPNLSPCQDQQQQSHISGGDIRQSALGMHVGSSPYSSSGYSGVGNIPITALTKAAGSSFKIPELRVAMPRTGSARARSSNQATTSRKQGGRKPRDYDDSVNEEERDKRAKRRQRNKEAAARCRQRRLTMLEELQQQVDDLKGKNLQKELMINQLVHQRELLVDRLRQNNCPVPELNDDKIYAVPSFAVIPASSHQNSTNASLNGNMELNTTIASEHSSNHDISPLDELKNELDEPHSHEALEMNDDSLISEPMFANNKTENDKNREGVVGRPTSLRLNTLTFDGSLNLTTPSTGLITPSQLPGDYGLLCGRTFLTPIVNGPMLVQTSTPMQSNNGEFKNL